MAYYSQIFTVKMLAGSLTSSTFHLRSLAVCGIFGNPQLEGSVFGFQVSPDGGLTWQLLEDQNGDPISVNISLNEARTLNPAKIFGWLHIRLLCDMPQTVDRDIKLLVREV